MSTNALAALREARDAVENWAGYASEYFREKHDLAGDLAKLDAAIAELEAALSAPAVPEGYALVPVEPTLEMRKAGKHTMKGSADELFEAERATIVFAAMLAAAPQPPAVPEWQSMLCESHDSPWLICKTCAAAGKCAKAGPAVQGEAQEGGK